MDLSFLPHVNAALNSLAAILLWRGRSLAHAGRIEAHKKHHDQRRSSVSTVFLASYLAHKFARDFENTTLNVEGAAKLAYLAGALQPRDPRHERSR